MASSGLKVSMVLVTALSLLAQPPNVRGLDQIPAPQRASLIQRLDQLIALYREQDWRAVYPRLMQVPPNKGPGQVSRKAHRSISTKPGAQSCFLCRG